MEIDVIEKQKQFTEANVKRIQSAIENIITTLPASISDRFSMIITGSYGRSEASEESDLDIFTIVDAQGDVESFRVFASKLEDAICQIVPKAVGATGTFGFDVIISIEDILKDIGGVNDNNSSITRRMLMLLEGKALVNEAKFANYRRQLLARYIKEQVDHGQIAKFFLNDIIRYWRTMATDYEFKIVDEQRDWGVRNIKLKFSRKLLYVSGIIAVAQTVDGSRDDKIRNVMTLLDLCPVERIKFIGSSASAELTENLIAHYRYFVEKISKADVRDELNSIDRKSRNDSEAYRDLRDRGVQFSDALVLWLKATYPQDHQIHSAMLF